jgi:hypothetical protein
MPEPECINLRQLNPSEPKLQLSPARFRDVSILENAYGDKAKQCHDCIFRCFL